MTDLQIEHWAEVLFSRDCAYGLAVTMGFAGEDLSRGQFISLMRYMRDHEPSVDGLEDHILTLSLFDE